MKLIRAMPESETKTANASDIRHLNQKFDFDTVLDVGG